MVTEQDIQIFYDMICSKNNEGNWIPFKDSLQEFERSI